jgi:enoyl-CoA hydratase/carnithine racemase
MIRPADDQSDRASTDETGAIMSTPTATASPRDYQATHFQWSVEGPIGRIVLNRPERKNPLTFESYAELRDLFRGLVAAPDIRVIVVSGAGENFCSGGDVHEARSRG